MVRQQDMWLADRQRLRSLGKNLPERRWGIKYSSTLAPILQTCSRLLHSVLDWVLQEVDTSQDQTPKTSLRVNAYGRERRGILGLGSQEEPSDCHAGMSIVKERGRVKESYTAAHSQQSSPRTWVVLEPQWPSELSWISQEQTCLGDPVIHSHQLGAAHGKRGPSEDKERVSEHGGPSVTLSHFETWEVHLHGHLTPWTKNEWAPQYSLQHYLQ